MSVEDEGRHEVPPDGEIELRFSAEVDADAVGASLQFLSEDNVSPTPRYALSLTFHTMSRFVDPYFSSTTCSN